MRSEGYKNLWSRRVFVYAPLLFWIGVIFYFSSGLGSMSETSLFVRPILLFLFPDAPEQTLLLYHGYIRKFAHVAEYAVLGLLASRAVYHFFGRRPGNAFPLYAWAFTLLIASLDELNQSFNPARTGSGWDIVLDMTGSALGVSFFYLTSLLYKRLGSGHAEPFGSSQK